MYGNKASSLDVTWLFKIQYFYRNLLSEVKLKNRNKISLFSLFIIKGIKTFKCLNVSLLLYFFFLVFFVLFWITPSSPQVSLLVLCWYHSWRAWGTLWGALYQCKCPSHSTIALTLLSLIVQSFTWYIIFTLLTYKKNIKLINRHKGKLKI